MTDHYRSTASSRLAWFVTDHGLGHAARAAAVMEALLRRAPETEIHLFTTAPEAFFRDSLPHARLVQHPVRCDVGVVQQTALREDIDGTVERLDEFLPFDDALLGELATTLNALHCRLVVCDIAPMGIAAAARAGIPSVLVENFTWDWIYDGYVDHNPRMGELADYLRTFFRAADYHIQTRPACEEDHADLVTAPVSRATRQSPQEICERLAIEEGARTVLISMGGLHEECPFLSELRAFEGIDFLVPGPSQSLKRDGNLLFIPFRSDCYHPDLVQACNALVGKVGYSTMAEAYHAGVPFAYVNRGVFRESAVMADFIEKTFHGIPLSTEEYETGAWLERIPDLLEMPRIERDETNGADQAAAFIQELLEPSIG